MFAELNGGGIDWGINTEGLEYKKLSEIDQSKSYVVRGVFINRNKSEKELKEFGPSVVAILDDCLLSLPAHQEDRVQTIIDTPEMVAAVKAGKCGIGGFYTYQSHGRDCNGFKWIDL